MKNRITVKVGEQNISLLMTFGLLNEISRLVGDISRVAIIDLDADFSREVLSIVLVPRDKRGEPQFDDFDFPHDLAPEVAEEILDWVKEHVMSFFIRRIESTASLMERNADRLRAINSSQTGSEISALKTV